MKAILALEDGTIFEGRGFGASGECYGEVVFNTSMAGYQEILTDPSYKGQIVLMTYPLIGNYGINSEDVESHGIFVEGFVVREASNIASSWRSEETIQDYLKSNGTVGIEGIDTRALTRHIRIEGEMKAVISTEDLDVESLVAKAKGSDGLIGRDIVKDVTVEKKKDWCNQGKYTVGVLDCGVKYNILRELADRNCRVVVFPSSATADEILAAKPDGMLLSNGPGDPAAVPYVVETVKNLIGELPMFGICFGHQMLGQAMGGRTFKLKFGHHGGNHPVMDMKTKKVHITVQNHGFCVDIDSLDTDDVEITHINLNDRTLEGIRHKSLPIFSVQFHPESAPGPHDARYMFDEFVAMMESGRA